MLSKINETVVAVIAFVFVIAGIWEVAIPISEQVVLQLWQIVLAILTSLGLIGGGVALGVRSINKQIETKGVAETRVGAIARIGSKNVL